MMKSEVADELQHQHFHVLAVDDSLIDRKLLEKLLKLSSFQVTCVESVDKALEYLGLLGKIDESDSDSSISSSSSPQTLYENEQKGLKINLIMTDYCMPGMSGYDLLKRVKGSFWKDVPVVVMSSENIPSRINMCLEEGAEEFLMKPVQLSDLKKLQPCLLKSLDHTNYTEKTETIGNAKYDEEEDQNYKDINKTTHRINTHNFTKRKALSPQVAEIRTPNIKGLTVV